MNLVKNPLNIDNQEKPKAVAFMFSRIAQNYDLMNTLMTVGMDRNWRNLVTDLVKSSLADTTENIVLDIATGTGELALSLAKLSSIKGVIGVDLSPEMLIVAKTKYPKLVEKIKLAPMELTVADALKLPFPSNTFSTVTVGFGVRNFVDLKAAFSEMYRVTKPNGIFVCLELTRSPNKLFNFIFDIYFDKMIPVLGKIIARDPDAYHYLPESVKKFPQADLLSKIIRQAGWQKIKWKKLGFGTVAIHIGEKK